ncbi:MAG: hypothetical protein ACXW25_10395 [Rhodospirillales bacterium]
MAAAARGVGKMLHRRTDLARPAVPGNRLLGGFNGFSRKRDVAWDIDWDVLLDIDRDLGRDSLAVPALTTSSATAASSLGSGPGGAAVCGMLVGGFTAGSSLTATTVPTSRGRGDGPPKTRPMTTAIAQPEVMMAKAARPSWAPRPRR